MMFGIGFINMSACRVPLYFGLFSLCKFTVNVIVHRIHAFSICLTISLFLFHSEVERTVRSHPHYYLSRNLTPSLYTRARTLSLTLCSLFERFSAKYQIELQSFCRAFLRCAAKTTAE